MSVLELKNISYKYDGVNKKVLSGKRRDKKIKFFRFCMQMIEWKIFILSMSFQMHR